MWKRIIASILLTGLGLTALADAGETGNIAERLRRWQTGVWLSPGGTYTVWTETHYFVVQGGVVNDSANIYCGASQVAFTEKGIARKQIVRVRKTPGQALYSNTSNSFDSTGMEQPLVIDPSLFKPGQCVTVDGVIYDSVEEVTADYILLSTCNGDKIKLYRDGISAYLPAGGGEYRSFRIESM